MVAFTYSKVPPVEVGLPYFADHLLIVAFTYSKVPPVGVGLSHFADHPLIVAFTYSNVLPVESAWLCQSRLHRCNTAACKELAGETPCQCWSLPCVPGAPC